MSACSTRKPASMASRRASELMGPTDEGRDLHRHVKQLWTWPAAAVEPERPDVELGKPNPVQLQSSDGLLTCRDASVQHLSGR